MEVVRAEDRALADEAARAEALALFRSEERILRGHAVRAARRLPEVGFATNTWTEVSSRRSRTLRRTRAPRGHASEQATRSGRERIVPRLSGVRFEAQELRSLDLHDSPAAYHC